MPVIPEPKGDIQRLPKWAQEHIQNLNQHVNFVERELKRVSSQHPGSNVMLDGKIGLPAVSLPPNATIQFYMGEDREDYRDLIEIHHNRNDASGRAGTSLEVTGYGGRVTILPRHANSIALRLENL